MHHKTLQFIAAIPGIPMLLIGIGFVIDPEQAATGLGMPLLEGLGAAVKSVISAHFSSPMAGVFFMGPIVPVAVGSAQGLC
jgi:hypothetical protein